MPQEIKEYISTNESFSVSGRENSGQGGDFVHEELNKCIKALLPPIMLTADVWSRVCRKLPDLEEIRDNTIRPMESKSRYKNHVNGITMVRREIQSNMTISFNPEKTALLKSIDGLNLDPGLKDIKYIAKGSYKNYKHDFYETGTYSTKIKTPVFVMQRDKIEYNKIENKTKSEVIVQIDDLLKDISDEELSIVKCEEFKKRKNKVKHKELVDLYYDIKSIIDEQNATAGLIEEMTGKNNENYD